MTREHISLDGYPEQLLDTINPLALQLSELLKSYDNGHILSDGIKTVILGSQMRASLHCSIYWPAGNGQS